MMADKKMRLIAILTALGMLFCMGAGFSLPAAAEGQVEISSAEELIALANGDLAGSYIQTADIDLTDQAYSPIGTLSAPFTGTYDGNGYQIDGLKIESDRQYQGLFGVNNGTIRNVVLGGNCYVEGSAFVGGIAGRNNGIIEDCICDAKVAHRGVQEQQVPSFTVLSQNLCQWGDDALAANSSYVDSSTGSRRPSMLQRIQNLQPDIMLFQEVSFSGRTMSGKYISGWDSYLKGALAEDYTFVGDYRADDDKEGVTVAFNHDKYTCLRNGMFWLSENPDAPRAQQTRAWGAGCVRTCVWVLLEDESGQKIAAYSVHLDHVENVPLPREMGAKVVKEKMEELRAEFPDALFIVGGDYNEDPGKNGYNVTAESFDGMIDDTRYAVESQSTHEHTWEEKFASFEGATRTIDFIFADSSKLEVNSFNIQKDYYNNLRPSDHHGVFAEVEPLQNNAIGSITGSNGGVVRRIIARGEAEGAAAEAVGQAIGNNAASASSLYSADQQSAIGSGIMEGAEELPQTAEIRVVAALNKAAGRAAFTVMDGEYVVVGDKDLKVPTCLTVNGVDRVVYAGEVYTLEELGFKDGDIVFFNGEIMKEDSITVPENGGVIKAAESVSEIDSAVSSGDYAVTSMADWMHLFKNKEKFADREVIIHLLCDLDFSLAEAASFTTMENPAFSVNGHGHTIKNWGSEEAPVDQIGFFSVNEGAGGLNFIKNLNFENCHIKDITTDSTTGTGAGNGTALVYSVKHTNAGLAGLPTEVTIENVHVKGCSLWARNTEANGFILSRYGVPGRKINVCIRGCSVEKSVLDANNMDHKGLIIGKVRSNSSGNQANFHIEDCIVEGNEIKNSNGLTGFVLGNIEGTGVDAYLANVGVFDNISSGTNDGAIIGHMNQGGIVCKGVLMKGNRLNQSTKYVIAAQINNPVNVTTEAIYCDNTDLTAMVEAKSNTLTGGADAVASGEAGWGINKAVESPSFRWVLDGKGGYTKTADPDAKICRVLIRAGGAETKIFTMKGQIITLPDAEGEYTFAEGEGTIADQQIVVNMDLILSCMESVSSVSSKVTGGDYTVGSVEEWMELYENKEYFQNRNITIHLKADLDLSDPAAEGFTGFWDPYFSFDGHGHTIKNWGDKEKPIEAKGLFLAATGAGGLNDIKNIHLENCHLSDYEEAAFGENSKGNIGLVYSAIQGNDGLSGLPNALTLENITIKNCSLVTIGESCGLLLGRYAPSAGNHTVTIQNIRIEGSQLDAANGDHRGLLIGKPRSNNSGGTATFHVNDCYFYNNMITNADRVNVGLIFGTAEGSSVTLNLENIGVVGNIMERTGDGALVGYSDGGKIHMNQMIFAANHLSADKTYLMATKIGMGTLTLADVYSDETALTATAEAGGYTHTVAAEEILSGEINYILNRKLEAPSFYWGMKNGLPAPATAAKQTAKLTLMDEENQPLEIFYLNGGSQKALASHKNYTLISGNGAFLDGATLTMPEGGKDVAVRVSRAVCSYGDFRHIAGTDTHQMICVDCGDIVESAPCVLRAVADTLPAIGESFCGAYACLDACGNRRENQWMRAGDINNDGKVSIADVVIILQVIAEMRPADSVHCALGNVYQSDGVQENGELTTNDAVMLLRYILNK